MAGDVSNGIQGQQFDQTRYGDSLDTLDPVVLLLLGGGGHPVDGVLPLHHLQPRRVRVRFHTKKRCPPKSGTILFDRSKS